MDINFAVPCLLGLEAPIAEELRNMEASDVRAENGRVLFSGDENILARANICSRFSERVLVLLGSFEAHSLRSFSGHTRPPVGAVDRRRRCVPRQGLFHRFRPFQRARLPGDNQKSGRRTPKTEIFY